MNMWKRESTDLLAVVVAHHFEKIEGTGQVVLVIAKRHLPRFANRLQSTEVDNSVERSSLLKNSLNRSLVVQIGLFVKNRKDLLFLTSIKYICSSSTPASFLVAS